MRMGSGYLSIVQQTIIEMAEILFYHNLLTICDLAVTEI